ncbi:hypothetical protein SO802_014879 [Lithocarpus litseifolius]|uniref:Uncharacterized protein n=1 Tax=Lithocarpus litseifolius TaxID=425828 RepID=A0AAW2CS79_9ROSI
MTFFLQHLLRMLLYHFSDPSSSTEQLNKQLKPNSSSSSKALVVKSSKPFDLSSHTKSKPSNPNLATMVKKFMEKKTSFSSSKAVKMVIPSDVIAEDLKKTARKGTSFKGLHRSCLGLGMKRQCLTENTRTLAMVLRSERELLGMNKEQEMEISQLKFMLEENSTETRYLKGKTKSLRLDFGQEQSTIWSFEEQRKMHDLKRHNLSQNRGRTNRERTDLKRHDLGGPICSERAK